MLSIKANNNNNVTIKGFGVRKTTTSIKYIVRSDMIGKVSGPMKLAGSILSYF